MKTILETVSGKIINGDNLEVLDTLEENSVDSCISDFPYDLSFMGKKWDNTGNFYEWNKVRAEKLLRVIKHGGYVAVFGHPKTNHRMKCAFEDVGFKIVEEIDWVYFSGMPKSQDISKLFDKAAGAERKVIGEKGLHGFKTTRANQNHGVLGLDERTFDQANQLTAPSTELAKKWDGWRTSGLKPSHEPITIFQKPLKGTYINNIEQFGCGGMNIDACRVEHKNESDLNMVKAKCNFTKNSKSIGFGTEDSIYGTGNTPLEQARQCVNEGGRFPSNMILDEYVAEMFDEQSNGNSKIFTIIKYNAKVSPSERKLPNGERNPHVTLKPVELIKWLIKLLTPIDGTTIDITAGSCTHAVASEQLNKSDGYSLKYIDIEMMNTEEEPYCNVGKMRVEDILANKSEID